VKFWFNPITTRFEIKEDITIGSVDVTIERDCDSSITVGDFVLESLTIPNKVEKCIDNTSIAPCIGVVVSKPSPTKCVVKQYGLQAGFTGLVQGRHVFLNIDGTPTSTSPTTGYLQILGVATSSNQILINVQILRVKRAL
jgi:hypothetical protein